MKTYKNLSIVHMIMDFLILFILIIPWYQLGLSFPSFTAGGKIIVDTKYIIVGFFFIITLILRLWETRVIPTKKKELKLFIAEKNACDKILIVGILILLAYNGFTTVLVPIMIISKEIIVGMIKNVSADNGKILEKSLLGWSEKITLNLGIILLLFYNLPFELWNFYFADAIMFIATILNVISGCIYYFQAKNMLLSK